MDVSEELTAFILRVEERTKKQSAGSRRQGRTTLDTKLHGVIRENSTTQSQLSEILRSSVTYSGLALWNRWSSSFIRPVRPLSVFYNHGNHLPDLTRLERFGSDVGLATQSLQVMVIVGDRRSIHKHLSFLRVHNALFEVIIECFTSKASYNLHKG
jgi:hypothetical protein